MDLRKNATPLRFAAFFVVFALLLQFSLDLLLKGVSLTPFEHVLVFDFSPYVLAMGLALWLFGRVPYRSPYVHRDED